MMLNPSKCNKFADAGDITCNPFSIDESIKQIEAGANRFVEQSWWYN